MLCNNKSISTFNPLPSNKNARTLGNIPVLISSHLLSTTSAHCSTNEPRVDRSQSNRLLATCMTNGVHWDRTEPHRWCSSLRWTGGERKAAQRLYRRREITLLVHPLNDFDYTDGNGMASMIMEATWNKDTSGRTLVLVVVVGGTLIQLNIDFILEGTK